MAKNEEFWHNSSLEKHSSTIFIILKYLENDNVDKSIDKIIERLTSDLGKTETCTAEALDALHSVLKLKVTRRKDQVEKINFSKTVHQCFMLLNATSFQNNQCAQHICDIVSYLLLFLDVECLIEVSQTIFSSCEAHLQCLISENLSRREIVFTIHVNLRILNTVLSTLIYRSDICKKHFLVFETISDVLLELMLCEVEQVTAYTALHVIPKLLKFSGTNYLLQKIWHQLIKISISANREDALVLSSSICPQVFQILCALAEYFIPIKDYENLSVDLTIQNEFWIVLQGGLTHLDPTIRKQGLYLMKRAVDSMYQRNLSVGLFTSQSLFWWDSKSSKQLIKIWEEFFLIIETLEEKQTHIIKPVLPLIDKLLEFCYVPFACGRVIDQSWLFVIFQRVVSHDSIVIVKWGVSHFVNINRKLHISQNEYLISKFTSSLLNAINNSALYVKTAENISSSEIREELSELFESVAIGNTKISTMFFSGLLRELESISWSPVPLFNVIYALSTISAVPIWDTQPLIQMKAFSLNALRTQNTFIRGAIQCLLLKCITKLSNGSSINLETVVDILGIFRDAESLKRGTSAWRDISHWLNMWISKDKATDFISKYILNLKESKAEKLQVGKRAVARIIILLCDSEIISINEGSPIHNLLQDLGDCFYDCRARSYVNETVQNESLEMVIYMLKEVQSVSDNTVQEDATRRIIINFIGSLMEGMFVYMWKRMCSSKSVQEYYLIEVCMDALDTLSTEPSLSSLIASKVSELQSKALLIAYSEMDGVPSICKYFSIRILAWISSCLRNYGTFFDSDICNKQKVFVEHIIKSNKLNHILVKEQEAKTSTRDAQTLWGRIVSGYLESLWCMFADYLHIDVHAESKIFNFTSASNITREASEGVEVGGRTAVIPVMKVLKKLLPHLITAGEISIISTLISMCWSSTFELRKTAVFWTSMRLFVEMMFQKSLINSAVFKEILAQYAGEIMSKGKAISGLSNILVKQLQDILLLLPEILEDYCEVLVDGLTFGSVQRRDQRIHSDTCAFIESLGDDCTVNILCSNDCSADNEVRARATQLLLSLCESSSHQCLVESVMNILIQKEKTECGGKNRYFGDSQLHHLKHRVMQALLLLEPALTLEHKNLLLKWLKDCLIAEGNQPSVRYQKEWLIVRILYHHPCLRQNIWDYFQEASRKRAGSLCSFISIIYHLTCIIEDFGEQEMFLERGMREIAPWCMAQQFTIRLYAQTIIQKLFLLCEKQNFSSTAEKYAVLKLCIQSSIQQGSAVKNSLKLQEDFYFNGFHPIRHYSLETIFNELPRLANVAQEECLSVSLLKSCGITGITYIQLENSDSILQTYSVASWVLKTVGDTGAATEERDESTYSETETSNVQKKLIPWKSMFPDVGLLLSSSDALWERKQRTDTEGIVVVASLIDKAPNLGGLCRTCEVFGASEYVISKLRYIEDKQFQLLSVTAEHWITITEVKVHLLSKYLEEKKQMGYTLIGAEQTANSKLLKEVEFPKKTMLLLGNEREGIPADLLPLLDVCVEIPQQGIVRSLNVHVTGALFLWEYCRQHMLK